MATFKSLTESEKNTHFKNIFEIISRHEAVSCDMTQDGSGETITLDSGELDQIKNEMYAEVQEGLTQDGAYQSASEMKESLRLKVKDNLDAFMRQETSRRLNEARRLQEKDGTLTQDGYFNPTTGVGTYIDPGMDTRASIPVSLTPNEATAYYANGGLPARVINKKAGCLSLNGVHFECSKFKPDEIAELEDYAQKCGFIEGYSNAITQALIFGGAVLYPYMKSDSPLTTNLDMMPLLKTLPEKDFISYWVTADRWNTVFVPDYNITAQDYMYAKSLFIPLGGYRVNTRRCAMVRPTKLPFWGAIRQLGWSTSDFEGWIKDYESYEIMKMSLPIMAQQMSLMYHEIPADSMIIENGPQYARKFFKENEAEMREWSMLHPKAINSVGEIKVIERTYTGFQQLIQEARLALCASTSFPETALFEEKSSGLASDNTIDITLKQSESIRLLFNNVAPSFKNCIELLVYSCFGKNSEQAKCAREVRIKADDGVILSDSDKANLGVQFVQIAGQLTAMGVPMKSAIETACKFVPSADIDTETLEAIAGEGEEIDESLWAMLSANRDNGLGMRT